MAAENKLPYVIQRLQDFAYYRNVTAWHNEFTLVINSETEKEIQQYFRFNAGRIYNKIQIAECVFEIVVTDLTQFMTIIPKDPAVLHGYLTAPDSYTFLCKEQEHSLIPEIERGDIFWPNKKSHMWTGKVLGHNATFISMPEFNNDNRPEHGQPELKAMKEENVLLQGDEKHGNQLFLNEHSKYIGTKTIHAERMNLGDYNDFRGWKIPENENPNREGYIVRYEDGYVSWSPKEVFEVSYRRTNGMNFGLATEAAKQGKKVAREGWNGKNMYAVIMPGYPDGIEANEATQKAHRIPAGTKLVYRPYWQLYTAQKDVAMWAPSGSDSLADDWCIVP